MEQSSHDGVAPDTVLIIFFVFFVCFSVFVGMSDAFMGNEHVVPGASDRAAAVECCRLLAIHIGLDFFLRHRSGDVRTTDRRLPVGRRRITHVLDSM